MGRKALLAVICWLTLNEGLGDTGKTVNNSVADNESAESAPRLYQNIPVGVYASGAPYGSFSFHAPTVIPTPHAAGSHITPVKAEVVQNTNGFLRDLKDSYGKFVQTPQTAAYKSAFPQQFVQLQELPAHLSQPLIAAAPSYQFKQTAPHFFFGSQQYRVPSLQQAATPTPITRFGSFSQPLVYAENIRSFAPSSGLYTQGHRFPISPQQSSSNQVHFGNPQTFQRLQERPQTQTHVVSENDKNANQQANQNDNGQIQAAPAQTSVTAIVNGKKTVITLDTKPVLPLLDLNLLEPLTFANPLVPQVQHFLPRINSATYHKLPQFNEKEAKKRNKEIFVQKTKSYDSGLVVGKPKIEAPKKKKLNKPRPQNSPVKPTITVKGSPNGGPEFSYEINTPNHKETYNEQVVSYHKETKMKPVEFSYNEQSKKEPVTYSFVRSSKQPVTIQHVEYESNPQNPKELIYKLSSQEKEEEQNEDHHPQSESEDSGESSDESEDEGPASQHQHAEHHGDDEESPQFKQLTKHNEDTSRYPQHHSEHHGDHQETPRQSHHHSSHHGHHEESPKQSHHHSNHDGHNDESPKHLHHHYDHHGHHEKIPKQSHHPTDHHGHQEESPNQSHHHSDHYRNHQELPRYNHHHSDTHDHHQEPPRPSHHHSNHHGHHEESPTNSQRQSEHNHHEESPRLTQHHASHHEHNGQLPRHSQHQSNHGHHAEPPRQHISNHHGNHESPRHSQHHVEHRGHHESPRQSHHLSPEHREEVYHHIPNQEAHQEIVLHSPGQYYSQPLTVTVQNAFQPITPEYEEDIRILPTHQPNAQIKVDPNQHVQLGPLTPRENEQPAPAPQKLPRAHEQHDLHDLPPTNYPGPQSSPLPHIFEKSKRVIIKENEETPDEVHSRAEQVMEEMREQEENNEEDFEKGYKESAFGFPAYEEVVDIEKDIYNPGKYGYPRHDGESEVEHTPFEQYQQEDDEFPKSSRSNYKDAREKMKENYFLDFSVNKPESLTDRYRNKVDYYKLYMKNRPEKLFAHEEGEKKKQKQKENYVAEPSYVFHAPAAKSKQYFAQYKTAPKKFEHEYSKKAPLDSSAYASRSYQKHKTHFVEPQFQYGFEPISAPLVIDSELAAMASNDSPESEKPGLRKKVYKENWYIKKTRTTAGNPS